MDFLNLRLLQVKWIAALALIMATVPTIESSSSCYLQDGNLRQEWRLVLEYSDEQLNLLRQREVKNGSRLYMVCNGDDIIEVDCVEGQFQPAFPLPHCWSPLRPQLKMDTNGALCPYQLYLVGYSIRCKDVDYFFDTYKVCFDLQQMRAVFTINEAYPFVQPRPRDMRFDPDEIFTMNIFAAYNKRDIYARFRTLLGDQQLFMSSNEGDRRIDRGHLTPVADYMTNTLIATTFKMINVIPQFHTVNDGNWKLMEEWARNPINTPCKVCSGALHWVLHLPNAQGQLVPIYLRDNRIPIPLWTYKVVLNSHGIRTAFLQYNNIHDTGGAPQIPGDICRVVPCPASIYLHKFNLLGFTYCCEEGHFMRTVIPNLQGYC